MHSTFIMLPYGRGVEGSVRTYINLDFIYEPSVKAQGSAGYL